MAVDVQLLHGCRCEEDGDWKAGQVPRYCIGAITRSTPAMASNESMTAPLSGNMKVTLRQPPGHLS